MPCACTQSLDSLLQDDMQWQIVSIIFMRSPNKHSFVMNSYRLFIFKSNEQKIFEEEISALYNFAVLKQRLIEASWKSANYEPTDLIQCFFRIQLNLLEMCCISKERFQMNKYFASFGAECLSVRDRWIEHLISVKLKSRKHRVLPLKSFHMPRLELLYVCYCLDKNVYAILKNIIKTKIELQETLCWCDCMDM